MVDFAYITLVNMITVSHLQTLHIHAWCISIYNSCQWSDVAKHTPFFETVIIFINC